MLMENFFHDLALITNPDLSNQFWSSDQIKGIKQIKKQVDSWSVSSIFDLLLVNPSANQSDEDKNEQFMGATLESNGNYFVVCWLCDPVFFPYVTVLLTSLPDTKYLSVLEKSASVHWYSRWGCIVTYITA